MQTKRNKLGLGQEGANRTEKQRENLRTQRASRSRDTTELESKGQTFEHQEQAARDKLENLRTGSKPFERD